MSSPSAFSTLRAASKTTWQGDSYVMVNVYKHGVWRPHLCLVVFEQLWSLEAHLGCDEVGFNAERCRVQVQRLGELKALQARLLACNITHTQRGGATDLTDLTELLMCCHGCGSTHT